MVVLDTCALLWWALAPDQLSEPASKACKRMERQGGWISSISIWEIGIKSKKGKLDIGVPLGDFVARIKRTRLEILPVDESIWMENLALVWPHSDPCDRTIVATAKLRGLPLITADQTIRSFYSNVIW